MVMNTDSMNEVKLMRMNTSDVVNMARVMRPFNVQNARHKNSHKINDPDKMVLTMTMRQGAGVQRSTVMRDMNLGMCPSRAPTNRRRDDAKIPPLTDPKVEHATKNGISHRITPSSLSPKV